MNFFQKAANGWEIAKSSYQVLNANRSLLIFPLLSGASLMLILSSLVVGVLSAVNWNTEDITAGSSFIDYFFVFLYYVVNYFVIVFFNTALTHCVSLYLQGQPVSVKQGIAFSFSRIGSIFSWALFAATVGTILQILQENLGFVGKIITGLVGVVFNVATFFVVPVMAYENLGPVAAFERSAQLMKEKWGTAIGASFNFGFVQFIAIIFIAIIAITLGTFLQAIVGVAFAVASGLLLIAVISAAKIVFITAVYNQINGNLVAQYDRQFIDNLFVGK